MGDLRKQFSRFYEPTSEERQRAFETGLVVLDTNVLLSLYRFTSNAREQLFAVLEKLDDRLWVPYQVGLEFHQRRLSVIAEQDSALADVRKELEAASAEYEKRVSTFANRIALGKEVTEEVLGQLRSAFVEVDKKLEEMVEERPIRLDEHNADPVLARLEQILDSRVGYALDTEELAAAKTEAERRIAEQIPPGYMDRGKPDPTGDYIVWLELKKEAAKRKVPVVLVTDDKKEDWFRRDRGLTLGPRVELYAELEQEAEVQLHLLTTETFLLLSQKYLEVEVSSATVDEAKSLPKEQLQEQVIDWAARHLADRTVTRLVLDRQLLQEIIVDAAKRRDQAAKQLDVLRQQLKARPADEELIQDIHKASERRDKAAADFKEAQRVRDEINLRLHEFRVIRDRGLSGSDWQMEMFNLTPLDDDDGESSAGDE